MNNYPHSLEYTREFHESFEIPILDKPQFPSEDRRILRLELLKEELLELADAIVANDIVEVADALCDLQVVLDGTFLEFGLGDIKNQLMELVHISNMSKLGEDNKPIRREDGKVLKGPNFEPPKIGEFLIRRYGYLSLKECFPYSGYIENCDFSQAMDCASKFSKDLKEKSEIDPKLLNQPMTI